MVKLIVAIGANRAIGKDNDLIWHLPADMRFFSETTRGHIVIMGRKNWESIPSKYRPLDRRLNVVITRDKSFSDEGCVVFHSIESAIEHYANDERTSFIIGGGQIYAYCLEHNLIDEMLITHIKAEFEADTFFPEFDKNNWTKTSIMHHPIDDKNPHEFEVYSYKKK